MKETVYINEIHLLKNNLVAINFTQISSIVCFPFADIVSDSEGCLTLGEK